MKNLSDKAMLVNLKISYWSGKKNDKSVERDVEQQHKTANAGKYRKNLIPAGELSMVQVAAGALRRYFYTNTTPWGDNGDRLLPAKHYMKFTAEFRDIKEEFDTAKEDFLQRYPSLVANAPSSLKTLYKAKDYPSLDRMRKKFRLDLNCFPIASVDDFRMEIDPDEIEALKKQMQQDYNERIAGATKDIWDRVKETVGHMVKKLSEKKPIFHDTLVSNIRDLVTLLPQLNFTDNPDIARAVEDMKKLVVSPENLRKNRALRTQAVKQAEDMMSRFSAYME